MEHLSQRELRNESGRVLRAVSEGHSFVLTNKGQSVGRLVPLEAPQPGLVIVRSARRRGGWRELGITRKAIHVPLPETLEELREDRL
ncbi:type II toxin-antitoxin system Phd/YefM family antitoxin [Actinomyces bovis]|uniref:type II toxin-antitoxin system Phd/YefM family antitoxin n=1 Tax=Actinomyces bovis TaxID=1658 RepID=UPI00389910E1